MGVGAAQLGKSSIKQGRLGCREQTLGLLCPWRLLTAMPRLLSGPVVGRLAVCRNLIAAF